MCYETYSDHLELKPLNFAIPDVNVIIELEIKDYANLLRERLQ